MVGEYGPCSQWWPSRIRGFPLTLRTVGLASSVGRLREHVGKLQSALDGARGDVAAAQEAVAAVERQRDDVQRRLDGKTAAAAERAEALKAYLSRLEAVVAGQEAAHAAALSDMRDELSRGEAARRHLAQWELPARVTDALQRYADTFAEVGRQCTAAQDRLQLNVDRVAGWRDGVAESTGAGGAADGDSGHTAGSRSHHDAPQLPTPPWAGSVVSDVRGAAAAMAQVATAVTQHRSEFARFQDMAVDVIAAAVRNAAGARAGALLEEGVDDAGSALSPSGKGDDGAVGELRWPSSGGAASSAANLTPGIEWVRATRHGPDESASQRSGGDVGAEGHADAWSLRGGATRAGLHWLGTGGGGGAGAGDVSGGGARGAAQRPLFGRSTGGGGGVVRTLR